jgi:hypothetical protein
MQPIDHFNSQLVKFEASIRPGQGLEKKDADYLEGEFSGLVAPVLGKVEAADLFRRTLGRCEGGGGRVFSLGKIWAIAAFLLGEEGDDSVLDAEDWGDIKETLEDLSGEMDLDTLTALMGEMLERGKI